MRAGNPFAGGRRLAAALERSDPASDEISWRLGLISPAEGDLAVTLEQLLIRSLTIRRELHLEVDQLGKAEATLVRMSLRRRHAMNSYYNGRTDPTDPGSHYEVKA